MIRLLFINCPNQGRIFRVALILLAANICVLSPSVHAEIATSGAAPVPAKATRGSSAEIHLLPSILSDQDRVLYQRIFALQKDGQWPQADKLLRQVENRLLLGHVFYQRYMHPTRYRSKYSELSRWMAEYADHPGARLIYRLAMRRKPSGASGPRAPASTRNAASSASALNDDAYVSPRRRSGAQRREIARLRQRITKYLRQGRPERAEKRLWASERQNLFDQVEFNDELTRIASGYFFQKAFEKSYALADIGAEAARDHVWSADWIAGLSAWQMKRHKLAAYHFERLAASRIAPDANVAAGAYWAARAHLVSGTPEKVIDFLAITAHYADSFYGLIATRQLAVAVPFSWAAPSLKVTEISGLLEHAAVRRALSLSEINQPHLADGELRLTSGRLGNSWSTRLLGLATLLKLPATQLQLARESAAREGKKYYNALYPVPDWTPQGGFKIDRALIFALMRQESNFNSTATSRAGARGVMQLMPRTASYVAQDRSLRYSNRTKLFEPTYNMALGQQYLELLLGLETTGTNLFLLTTAYNGGPGNLSKWLRASDHHDDWLFFIENLPARETRHYTKQVLTNLWIYRMRLGQPTPSLEAVASGLWPEYVALDEI